MKIYTKTGDKGTTGILGKSRVAKHDIRIETYGTVDELNSQMGMSYHLWNDKFQNDITNIQSILFEVGTELAYEEYHPMIKDEDTKYIEMLIDRADDTLPKLTSFILPSGTKGAVHAHILRTICRRAERLLVAFSEDHQTNPHTLVFLNRLSDLFFTWARLINFEADEKEIEWKQRE